jgi:hypothetical protein
MARNRPKSIRSGGEGGRRGATSIGPDPGHQWRDWGQIRPPPVRSGPDPATSVGPDPGHLRRDPGQIRRDPGQIRRDPSPGFNGATSIAGLQRSSGHLVAGWPPSELQKVAVCGVGDGRRGGWRLERGRRRRGGWGWGERPAAAGLVGGGNGRLGFPRTGNNFYSVLN